MLDIKFIRENPDLVREAARKKHVDFDVGRLLEVDERRRTLAREVDDLRRDHNRASEEVGNMEGGEKEKAIRRLRVFKEDLSKKEETLRNVENEYYGLMLLVPNIPDPSVPEGDSDADNVEIRRWGDMPSFNFEPKNHIALMRELDLVDFERGAKVSGFRGYFLKNEAIALSMALWWHTLEYLRLKKGFYVISAPALVRGDSLVGTGWLPQGKDEVYRVDNDLYLAGTAEVPVMGMHQDEMFLESELPKKYVAFSPCFRSEAGSYGKDTKGLYRLHEFIKVEQVVLCRADHEESVRWHEELTRNAEEIVQALGLPYRVVANCGGDLGLGQVKKYDIECWLPSQKKYGETHSSSYFHDFQTRRLNIRYKDKEGNTRFPHSLNNTAIATPRILIALLENYQQQDGSIVVPGVLQKWMGKEKILKPGLR